MLKGKRILLVIGGGIAAYKVLDLVRRLKERGADVRAIMTAGGQEFVTPLSVGALTGNKVHTDLFDLADEQDIGHIALTRDCDLIVVAPATANLIARMAHGFADELATASLLAAAAPVIICPAMNPRMWSHPATQRNVAQLKTDGVAVFGPAAGKMAERGEDGVGRLLEPLEIVGKIEDFLRLKAGTGTLAGRHVLVTSGPTLEPIDPVRYIANRSSGKQGHAIAIAAAKAGARVTLVSGPVRLADPDGVTTVHVETALEMKAAVEAALPADIAIMAAAVADWRVRSAAAAKIKKDGSGAVPPLALTENPDILSTVGHGAQRPRILVGFAAETNDVIDNGSAKLKAKAADFIVANDVSPERGVMGGERNMVHVIGRDGVEHWPEMDKSEVAERLIALFATKLGG